jgi:thioredoxin reductase
MRSASRADSALRLKVEENKKIKIKPGIIDEILIKDNQVSGVKFADASEANCDGIFIFAGLTANTDFLKDSGINLSDTGLILADQNNMTNLPGVFVAGDSKNGADKQIAIAVGDGAKTAISARKYLRQD